MSIAFSFMLLANLLSMQFGCTTLMPPIDGAIVRPYAPVGLYGGHWGIDFGANPGTVVWSAGPGTVTFAGSVAGRLSVTVSHGGGLRTSYSYLDAIGVRLGSVVSQGEPVGLSGTAHGVPALHFSVRVGAEYRYPSSWFVCVPSPGSGLRLAPVFGRSVYPRKRATRHPRRNLRPPSHETSVRRRGGISGSRPGHRDVPSGRDALAESGSLYIDRWPSLGDDPPRS